MHPIRLIGWLVVALAAATGAVFIFFAVSGDEAGIDSTAFLFGFICIAIAGLFLLFTEILYSQLLRPTA